MVRPNNSVQLVLTVALKAEFPQDFARTAGVPVISLKSLKSGRKIPAQTGTVIVVTGVGPHYSRQAAEWIRDHLTPLFVVNVGTVGAFTDLHSLGKWITPLRLRDETGRALSLDDRLPFPWNMPRKRGVGGTLLSVSQTDWVKKGNERAQYVDMESFAQADVFSKTPISFHVLKFVSDLADGRTPETHKRSLKPMRHQLAGIFSFFMGPKDPAISVVIPVYRRSPLIDACIRSALTQSLPAEEIIVVDDGSHDNSLTRALKKFEAAIIHVSSRTNRGVSWARNHGAEVAQGAWICFLDSDDRWKEDKLRNQWDFLQRYPFYEILQSNEIWIRNARRVNPCRHHEKSEGWEVWHRSLERCMVTPSAVMLKKSLFEKSGGFNEALRACEDYELWLRLSRTTPVGLEPSYSVIKYGGHEDQLSRRYPMMDHFRVSALLDAWQNEPQDEFRVPLLSQLKKKLRILIKGSEKRRLDARTTKYQEILHYLEDPKPRKREKHLVLPYPYDEVSSEHYDGKGW